MCEKAQIPMTGSDTFSPRTLPPAPKRPPTVIVTTGAMVNHEGMSKKDEKQVDWGASLHKARPAGPRLRINMTALRAVAAAFTWSIFALLAWLVFTDPLEAALLAASWFAALLIAMMAGAYWRDVSPFEMGAHLIDVFVSGTHTLTTLARRPPA